MALQLGAVLSAFRAANVPDDVAQRAAEESAGYENRFHDLDGRLAAGFADMRLEFGSAEQRFNQLDAKVEQRFTKLDSKIGQVSLSGRSETSLLRWMIKFNLGLSLLMLGRMFGVIHG